MKSIAAVLVTLCVTAPIAHADRAPAVALSSPPATSLFTALDPGARCRAAIASAERVSNLPPHLLAAIARVESGRPNGRGEIDPWPWSINVEGTDHVYESAAEAIAAVRAFQARGARSIDVGCLQVNLLWHPDAFASLEEAFDPVANAAYGARFLSQLFAQTGSWSKATAAYHSQTPELGEPYARKVEAASREELRLAGSRGSEQGVFTSGWPLAALPAPGPMLWRTSGSGDAARPQPGRVLPLASGAAGRGLEAYRAAPVAIVAFRRSG